MKTYSNIQNPKLCLWERSAFIKAKFGTVDIEYKRLKFIEWNHFNLIFRILVAQISHSY